MCYCNIYIKINVISRILQCSHGLCDKYRKKSGLEINPEYYKSSNAHWPIPYEQISIAVYLTVLITEGTHIPF